MTDLLNQGYWLMPNAVLFNKELTDKQKLLFCLISSLCAEKWYCRASNEYLWELLNADKWTISKNIWKLNEKWFIVIKIDNRDSKNSKREISIGGIVKNDQGYSQKWLGGIVKNDYPILQENNTSEKKENKEKFDAFRKQYPHARKGKKKESEQYFYKQDSDKVMQQVAILKRKIKAWLQDAKYIPACERWIRDFTELNEDVIKQDLVRICKWHLNAEWDMKQRASELKETFWEEQIREIVKAIQQKDSPKNLFIKQTN